MFENIEDYIQKSVEERRNHLDLSSACIEIGGIDSREYRGLLAHHLRTSIPTGKKVVLCHACNNSKCSNPNHLYWGTYSENLRDAFQCGAQKSIFEHMVAKYGEEEARRRQSNVGKAGGKAAGDKARLTDEKLEDYRKKLGTIDKTKRGWVGEAMKLLGVSHTHVRRIVKRIEETIPQ